MAEESKISWTDATFSPWRGCVEVDNSPACDFCYAKSMAKRNPGVLGHWGTAEDGGTRVVASEKYWNEPLKWNSSAEASGIRKRVFCASIADVFENWTGPMMDHKGNVMRKDSVGRWITGGGILRNDFPLTMQDVRNRLFGLIDKTPWLSWLLLTKRPENIRKFWPPFDWQTPADMPTRTNVWLGVTAENQEQANKRIPELLNCHGLSPVLWLSCEPLLSSLDLMYPEPINPARMCCSGFECGCYGMPIDPPLLHHLDWVVVGGESGPHARSSDIEWYRSLRDQCRECNVAFHFKQLSQADSKDFKDFDKFPEDLKIREYPTIKEDK